IRKPPHLALLVKEMDGRCTVGEMIGAVREALGPEAPDAATLLAEFRPFYRALQLSNSLLLRQRDTVPLATRSEMQQRLADEGA
ncbi:MAG: hypothetical protein ACE5ET_08700, partial [Gammaproteobacteria bacterium]